MKKRGFYNKLFIGLVNGIVVLLPVCVTFLIIRFIVTQLNDVVLTPILLLLHPEGAAIQNIFLIKFLIFVVVLAAISIIGWGARLLFISRVINWGEDLFGKIPFLGKTYKAIKQISTALLGQGAIIFKNVVLIEYPRKGIFSIGFTTGETKGEVQDKSRKELVNVFIPTTPNPTSGLYIMVPRPDIVILEMTVEDGMKLIISGGYVTPV